MPRSKARDIVRCAYPCAVTKREQAFKVAPNTKQERFKLLEEHGICAYLVPHGTPSSPGSPNFPIVNKRGCFHCGLARAAYTRIGQSLNRSPAPAYRDLLMQGRRRIIQTALMYANKNDKGNSCNWAIRAAKRYL